MLTRIYHIRLQNRQLNPFRFSLVPETLLTCFSQAFSISMFCQNSYPYLDYNVLFNLILYVLSIFDLIVFLAQKLVNSFFFDRMRPKNLKGFFLRHFLQRLQASLQRLGMMVEITFEYLKSRKKCWEKDVYFDHMR